MMQDYVAKDSAGRILKTGDKVKTFRGEEFTYIRITRLPQIGKSAKVYVQSPDNEFGQEFYSEVFDIKVFPTNFVEFEAEFTYEGKTVMVVYWLPVTMPIPENVTESWADDNALTVTYRYITPE